MYEVEANSVGCIFNEEQDAINALLMAIAMVEDINCKELYEKIKFDLNNRKDNTYEYNYYMSIRKLK